MTKEAQPPFENDQSLRDFGPSAGSQKLPEIEKSAPSQVHSVFDVSVCRVPAVDAVLSTYQTESHPLSKALAHTIYQTVGTDQDLDRSEFSLLFRRLEPYLDEFPFLAHDAETVQRIDDLLNTPIEVPDWIQTMGVFDAADGWICEEQHRRLVQLLTKSSAEK